MSTRNAYFSRRYGAVDRREPGREQLIRILAELDGQRACVYCGGRDDLTIDHVVPESRLAEFAITRGTPNNKVLACQPCNWRKHDMTPAEAGMAFAPWVRRRTWLGRSYADRAIPPRSPTGWRCPAYSSNSASCGVALRRSRYGRVCR